MARSVRPFPRSIEEVREKKKMENELPKQIIVIRRDLNMRRGKEIAQGSHASIKFLVDAVVKMEQTGELNISEPAWEWMANGHFTKVTVQVDSESELLKVYNDALAAGILASLITDEGATEFNNVHTNTAVAIGPDYPNRLAPITGNLVLY